MTCLAIIKVITTKKTLAELVSAGGFFIYTQVISFDH